MWVLLCFFALLFAPGQSDDLIFKPLPGKSSEEYLLVLIPGGGVPVQYYTQTAETIQNFTSFSLWVGVPDFSATGNLCDPMSSGPLGVRSKVSGVVSKVVEAGFPGANNISNVFMSGHSLGSACASIYFKEQYASFLLFGGCVSAADGGLIEGVVRPTLCFTGELDDGLVPVIFSSTMAQFLQLQKEEGTSSALTNRPVVQVVGMAHLDFCPGYIDLDSHFTSELTEQQSQTAIGTIVSSFLQLHFSGTVVGSTQYKNSLSVLSKYNQVSLELLRGYMISAEYQNKTQCSDAQVTTSPDINNNCCPYHIQNEFIVEQSLRQLENAHTSISKQPNGTVDVLVVSMDEFALGRSVFVNKGVIVSPASALDLACKMISADKVAQVQNISQFTQGTCESMNQKALDFARKYASQSTLERFDAIGTQIVLQADTPVKTGPDWVDQKLIWDTKSVPGQVQVSSIQLLSTVQSKIFPGNFYCKLLSPARVIEWMMSFGLPHNTTIPQN